MTTPAQASNALRTRGLQFVKLFQSALRLLGLYSVEHHQVQKQIERAYVPLEAVLQESHSLSVGFQFDRVVLNSLALPEPTLAPLAGELAKRRIGALVFFGGITEMGLGRMLSTLATRPETIEESGGLMKFLQSHPLERARIVPLQMSTADGSLVASAAEIAAAAVEGVSVGASVEMVEAMGRIPSWVLHLLQELRSTGGGQVATAQEIAALAESMPAHLVPEQIATLQQLQELLARVARRASLGTLSEMIRTVQAEVGPASAKLLAPALLRGLTTSIESGDLPQAEQVLLAIAELQGDPESALEQVPAENFSSETRQHFQRYLAWLKRPKSERLEELRSKAGSHELRWLAVEVEHALVQGNVAAATELLLALLSTPGPAEESERAEALARAQRPLAALCSTGLPEAAEKFVETIAKRLQEEESAEVSKALVEPLVILAQAAADRQRYALAAASAAPIAELAQEFSPRGEVAREAQSRLLKPDTVSQAVRIYIAHKDPEVDRALLALLKKTGDQVARELLAMLERERVGAKRMRILQVIKQLGKSAAEAIAAKISDPQWYVVRNAVVALAELADPALLSRIEPALSHPDERVQQAAVSAALKTRSPMRALPLARALPHLKPAMLETVLDDLLALKEPQAVPYLEKFFLQSGSDTRPVLLQKVLAALGSVATEDAAHALLHCAKDPSFGVPVRQAALRALARLELPAARQLLAEFARATSDSALAEEARNLLGA